GDDSCSHALSSSGCSSINLSIYPSFIYHACSFAVRFSSPLWGGKKTTHAIDSEKERDAPLYKAPRVPLSTLQQRDAQKQKLQDAMEGKTQNSKGMAPLPGRERVRSAPKS